TGSVAPRRVVPRRPRLKLSRNLWIALAILALAGSFFLWRYFSSYESTDDAQVDVHLYPVSSRVAGYAVRFNVNDNQLVQAVTELVEIDPRDYEFAVDRARADLADAESTAQALTLAVTITSVTAASQLSAAASDVHNTTSGIAAAEQQLTAAHAQVE